jgi:hypothetical protein
MSIFRPSTMLLKSNELCLRLQDVDECKEVAGVADLFCRPAVLSRGEGKTADLQNRSRYSSSGKSIALRQVVL